MTIEKVAIVGIGVSHVDYIIDVCKVGNRKAVADEVWAINKMGAAIHCDAIFRMDDLQKEFPMNQKMLKSGRVQDVWYDTLKNFNGKLFTSKAYPEFPASIDYPLEDVINHLGVAYFNTGPAYAIGYAIMLGVKEIALYGIDYTYPDKHIAESGRACVEFHLRDAMKRGIKVTVCQNSTLLDTNKQTELYGYTTPVNVVKENEKLKVVWRNDLAAKSKQREEQIEMAEFNRLLKKFKPELLDAEVAVQEESLKGEE